MSVSDEHALVPGTISNDECSFMNRDRLLFGSGSNGVCGSFFEACMDKQGSAIISHKQGPLSWATDTC
jgi:hypothetical protein